MAKDQVKAVEDWITKQHGKQAAKQLARALLEGDTLAALQCSAWLRGAPDGVRAAFTSVYREARK